MLPLHYMRSRNPKRLDGRAHFAHGGWREKEMQGLTLHKGRNQMTLWPSG